MKRVFIDVVQISLSNGTTHAFYVLPEDAERLADAAIDGFFVCDAAVRRADMLPCHFAVRHADIEWVQFLKEPAMLDETTGLVSPDSVPVGPTGEPVAPEGEEHPVTGLVYAFFRSTDEPISIELVADRAYVGWDTDEDVAENAQEEQEDDEDDVEHDDEDEETGPLQHVFLMLDLMGEEEVADSNIHLMDSDGETTLVRCAHLSLLLAPSKLLDQSENEELTEMARAAVALGAMRYGMDGMDTAQMESLMRRFMDEIAQSDPRRN